MTEKQNELINALCKMTTEDLNKLMTKMISNMEELTDAQLRELELIMQILTERKNK